jgi:hypothetical protein
MNGSIHGIEERRLPRIRNRGKRRHPRRSGVLATAFYAAARLG